MQHYELLIIPYDIKHSKSQIHLHLKNKLKFKKEVRRDQSHI